MKNLLNYLSLRVVIGLLVGISGLWTQASYASMFKVPAPGSSIVGHVERAIVFPGDTIGKVAHHYDVGYCELIEANPGIDKKRLTIGQRLLIPTELILPNVPHEGIIINLAELRLYYFPKDRPDIVYSYPVGIGREGWQTPLGQMKVVEKITQPTWHVPKSIQKFRASEGVILPDVVPPGPDNPLGPFAMRLTQPDYLIHGTNENPGVGRRASGGCIRMYNKDVTELFSMASIGTPVRIINEPYKIGWEQDQLYMEAHVPLQEQLADYDQDMRPLIKDSIHTIIGSEPTYINWQRVLEVAFADTGLPQYIGYKLHSNMASNEQDLSDMNTNFADADDHHHSSNSDDHHQRQSDFADVDNHEDDHQHHS